MWELYAADVGENIAVVKPLAARPFLPTADGEFETVRNDIRKRILAVLLKFVPGRCIFGVGQGMIFKFDLSTTITNDA